MQVLAVEILAGTPHWSLGFPQLGALPLSWTTPRFLSSKVWRFSGPVGSPLASGLENPLGT